MSVATLSPDTATVVSMLEHLPAAERKIIVERVRDLIEKWEDEREWDEILAEKPETLKKLAQQARQEITDSKVSPMEF
jgi:UDP-2,3-diacylglucosamine pyrophosphatase LpxH